jgi:hypothetical protein
MIRRHTRLAHDRWSTRRAPARQIGRYFASPCTHAKSVDAFLLAFEKFRRHNRRSNVAFQRKISLILLFLSIFRQFLLLSRTNFRPPKNYPLDSAYL